MPAKRAQKRTLPKWPKIGDEVWVRGRVVEVSKPGTIGWANGMVVVKAITHGLNQDPSEPQRICTDLANIRRVFARRAAARKKGAK